MIWQDILMMGVNCIFIVSLSTQVISGIKEKTSSISLYTSLPTGIGLFAMSYALFTLNLYFTAMFTAASGILWMVIFFQKIHYSKIKL